MTERPARLGGVFNAPRPNARHDWDTPRAGRFLAEPQAPGAIETCKHLVNTPKRHALPNLKHLVRLGYLFVPRAALPGPRHLARLGYPLASGGTEKPACLRFKSHRLSIRTWGVCKPAGRWLAGFWATSTGRIKTQTRGIFARGQARRQAQAALTDANFNSKRPRTLST